MTNFAPITGKTLGAFLKMRPKEGQDGFVASNAVTLAQSIFEGGSEVHGIFDGDAPVGMMALVDMSHPDADLDEGDDPDGVYLWRLLIDGKHQRNGHGRSALEFTVNRARELGRAHVALSAVPDEGTPIPFYKKFGFSETGRIVDDEVELVMRLD